MLVHSVVQQICTGARNMVLLTALTTATILTLGSASPWQQGGAMQRSPFAMPSLASREVAVPSGRFPMATKRLVSSSVVVRASEVEAQKEVVKAQQETAKRWVDITRAAYAGRWAAVPPAFLIASKGNANAIAIVPIVWGLAYLVGKKADAETQQSIEEQKTLKKLEAAAAAPSGSESFIEMSPSISLADVVSLALSSGVTLIVCRFRRGPSTADQAPLLAF